MRALQGFATDRLGGEVEAEHGFVPAVGLQVMDREILLAWRRALPPPPIILFGDLETRMPFLPHRRLIGRAVRPRHAGRPLERLETRMAGHDGLGEGAELLPIDAVRSGE